MAALAALWIAALLLGFVNAVLRPILIILTLPFTLITLTDCDGRSLLDIRLPNPVTVGQYSGGSLSPDSKVSFFVGPTGDGFGISNFSGSADVTNVDGRLQLTFSWDTGDNGSPFDGAYEGTLDLPAVN